jgi:hypothetical protein
MITSFVSVLYRQLLYNTLLTFALGAIVGGILEYYIGDLIDRYGIWGTLGTLVFVLVGIIMFVALRNLLRTLLPPHKISMGPLPRKSKGIILVLGLNSNQTAPPAYHYHRPSLDRVWFITTDRTAEIADHLGNAWDVKCHREEVEHHYNPKETAGAVQRAVTHALTLPGFAIDDLTCDITGGTTAMTIGAIQKCQELGISMQMVPGQYTEDGRAEKPHEVIELRFA